MFSNSKARVRRLLALLGIGAIMFVVNANGKVFDERASLTASSSSQTRGDWDRYMIRGGEFSVRLPTAPAMASYQKERPSPFTKARIRYIIGAYSQGVVYAIYIAENKQPLEEFIAESRYSSPGDSKRELKLGNLSGWEYSHQDSDFKRVAQYFITKGYIYSFIAQGSYLGKPDTDIPKFFESIKFDSNETGLAIIEGAGDQPLTDVAPTDGSNAGAVSPKGTSSKARVITKPEPTYTEDARWNQVTGTVVLRAVFSSSGAVTNVRAVSGLPYGLTEKAIAAAGQIRFIPAVKDGHFVSMYIQLEYNFNLY